MLVFKTFIPCTPQQKRTQKLFIKKITLRSMANENVVARISSRLSRLDGVRTRLEDAIRDQRMDIARLLLRLGGLNPPGAADILEAFAEAWTFEIGVERTLPKNESTYRKDAKMRRRSTTRMTLKGTKCFVLLYTILVYKIQEWNKYNPWQQSSLSSGTF